MQVHTAFGFGIEGVPTCGHSRIDFVVFFAITRVEDEQLIVAQYHGLEQCKVSISAHRSLENIVQLNVVFIVFNEAGNTIFNGINSKIRILCDVVDATLQVLL